MRTSILEFSASHIQFIHVTYLVKGKHEGRIVPAFNGNQPLITGNRIVLFEILL